MTGVVTDYPAVVAPTPEAPRQMAGAVSNPVPQRAPICMGLSAHAMSNRSYTPVRAKVVPSTPPVPQATGFPMPILYPSLVLARRQELPMGRKSMPDQLPFQSLEAVTAMT
jgi:hypothetical protein